MFWEYKEIAKSLKTTELRGNYITSFKRQLDLTKFFNFILYMLRIFLLEFIKRIINLYYIILTREHRVIRYPFTTFLIFTQVYNINGKNNWLAVENGWEFQNFKILQKKINLGDTIIDVGALLGPYTIFFSKLIGDKGKVYSFEPDDKAFDMLKRNIELNNCFNVKLENFALSNKQEEAILWNYGEEGNSISSIKDHQNLSFKNKNLLSKFMKDRIKNKRGKLISLITLDKYCFERNIIPNGLKIDVEGLEGLVIEGGMKLIQKCKPWIILDFHSIFMNENERIKNWEYITKFAKEIIFLEGNKKKFSHGNKYYKHKDKVIEIPASTTFSVFIQF